MTSQPGRTVVRSAAVLLVFAGLAAALPASAVENGVYDRTNPAVTGFGFDVDGPGGLPPFSLCSGFVISDYALATAAHCVLPLMGVATSWAVALEHGSPDQPSTPPGIFNLAAYNFFDFPILVPTATAIDVHVHPNFDWTSLANDLAVLEFAPGTFSVRPVRLPPEGFLDRMARAGALYEVPVELAGCGTTEQIDDLLYWASGYCTRGFAIVTGLTEQSLIIGTNNVMNARVLAGDSGSPQTMFGYAVSITSQSGNKQRLDTPDTLWLLNQFRRSR